MAGKCGKECVHWNDIDINHYHYHPWCSHSAVKNKPKDGDNCLFLFNKEFSKQLTIASKEYLVNGESILSEIAQLPKEQDPQVKPPHNHYYKDVSKLESIDVYRVLSLFGVTDPCVQHAVKKLLCAGIRGNKSIEQDVQEAIDSLNRFKQMQDEDSK